MNSELKPPRRRRRNFEVTWREEVCRSRVGPGLGMGRLSPVVVDPLAAESLGTTRMYVSSM